VKDRCFSASRTFGSFKAEGVVFFSTASGVGHGAAHAVFFGLSVIVPAFGPATYYTESCKQMPFFLVAGSPPSFSYLQISLQHQSVICSILCMLLCRKDVVNHALIYVVYGALCEFIPSRWSLPSTPTQTKSVLSNYLCPSCTLAQLSWYDFLKPLSVILLPLLRIVLLMSSSPGVFSHGSVWVSLLSLDISLR
jgi:hypothetical protein